MPSLFDPLKIGAIDAPNRIVMAPLTRGRATRDFVPTPVMADYYAQRASAGLIISEATGISVEGLGWPYAPGLWTPAQVEAWKPVVAAVHGAGGRCEVVVAVAWDCPFDGRTPTARALSVVERAVALGADAVCLADTIGTASPARVTELLAAVGRAVPHVPLGAHFHDTRGMGIANALTAA
mgnify:CR=1 FL=1